MHKRWYVDTRKWSLDCAIKKINPWVLFKRAGFSSYRDEHWFQQIVRRAYNNNYKIESPVSQQFAMIRDALLDFYGKIRYDDRRTAFLVRAYESTAKELESIEYYVQGIEYDDGVVRTDTAA